MTQQLSPAEAVNDIVLSIGHRENMVAVWVRSEFDEDRPFIQDVSESLRGLLGLKPTARIVHQHHHRPDQPWSAWGQHGVRCSTQSNAIQCKVGCSI